MKKLIVGMFIFIAVGAYANIAFLEKQWMEGSTRYCKYSNGSILTMQYGRNCPNTIKI